MALLVTGFGPFLSVTENPSSILAERSGKDFQLLEVAYDAVDEFISSFDTSSYDRLLLMGVARRPQVSIETVARNVVGQTPDVRNNVGAIDPSLPPTLRGTLWSPSLLNEARGDLALSDDAGSYLCNYVYYRALQHLTGVRVGFLHVCPFEEISFSRQAVLLKTILKAVC